ncbi:hypothetical protein F5Y19DRAFT_417348 [Xylariaceae sp. FL1651]|nr:hypothetical protein F5Y19DRAFT_417348 [Xylariaceae sp. FL1651]
MQYSLTAMLPVVLVSLLSLTQALPFETVVGRAVSNQDIADAQNQWRSDTSQVSQFLSAVPNLQGASLASAAQVALAAENDELLHKAVLDQAFGSDPRIVNANNILAVEQTFQGVVDALSDFAQNGASMSPSQVANLLQETNTLRCGQVLPAIDTYFRVAGEALQNGGFLVATRPNNC